MSEDRTCAWCGADISHRTLQAKFCSDKCKEHSRSERRYIRRAVNCIECGSKLVGQTRRARFCSKACAGRNYHRKNREKHREYVRAYKERKKLKGTPRPTVAACHHCGAEITIAPKGPLKKFCGSKCKQAFHRSHWSPKRVAAANDASRRWYRENREYAKARQRAYTSANSEAVARSNARWYRENREYAKAQQRKRTDRLRRERPDDYRAYCKKQSAKSREREKRIAAERAIALLILPLESPHGDQP